MSSAGEEPLRRNRDFVLLQVGQLLSNAGTQTTTIAYPLLALAVTGSAAQAGIVTSVRTLPLALLAVPAGVLADRWSRRRLMIAADLIRALALGGLAAILVFSESSIVVISLVAFIEGSATAVFSASLPGALRSVVSHRQLPAAVSVQAGRAATVQLVGPPLGGVLFGAARALPFVADAITYAASTLCLLKMRTPFQQARTEETEGRDRLRDAFRFVWNEPFVRTSAFLFGLANFIIPGLLFALVVIGKRQGLSGGEVGLLIAVFGACVLVGSLVASRVRRLLPTRVVMLLEFWAWTGCAAFVVWPSVYVLLAGMVPAALVIPSTDSVVHAYRIAITPDRLPGRAESVRRTISLAFSALGPICIGLLLGRTTERVTVGLLGAFALVLAVWATLSPVLRAAPNVGA